VRFQISHTHVYTSCRVTLAEEENEDVNLVEFSDGVIVPCQYMREGAAIILTIAPYRTARGTEIEEKSWILLQDVAKEGWKVSTRAPKVLFTD